MTMMQIGKMVVRVRKRFVNMRGSMRFSTLATLMVMPVMFIVMM